MSLVSLKNNASALLAALALITMFPTTPGLGAQGLAVHPSFLADLHSIKMVDVFNFFPNVGALITLQSRTMPACHPVSLGSVRAP